MFSMLLQDKTILLGISGSIAAYKAADLASRLHHEGAKVHTLMTQNACKLISPMTFEGVTGQKAVSDTFDRNYQYHVEHVSLAKQADLVLVAPATANVIAKLANGIADDMLTTTVLACRCKKMIAPAMNTGMYENPVTQDNLEKLRHYGWTIIEPTCGMLACGDVGAGKFPEPADILEYVLKEIAEKKDMVGLKVLVTAGPTQEPLDPVRYLTNHSTGKMGYELARNAMRRGAEVTLVSGKTALPSPAFVKTVSVGSAQEMFDAVLSTAPEQDLFAFAAAVADYRPAVIADQKLKKENGNFSDIPLSSTPDILKTIGSQKKKGQLICGFSMETEHLIENSRKKLQKKHADLIAANNLRTPGAGFGTDTNVITLISDSQEIELPQLSKYETAGKIWDTLLSLQKK